MIILCKFQVLHKIFFVLFLIDLFEKKGTGLFDLLDEEMKFPSPSEPHFTTELHSKNNKHFRLAVSLSPFFFNKNVGWI